MTWQQAGPGRPPGCTPAVREAICAAIREGCYASVAAARVGIGRYTLLVWDQRGKRELEQREQEGRTDPLSLYALFHLELERAKAEARYSAETRVFTAMPLHWLKNGYPRGDWRESDTLVRAVEDEVARKVAEVLGTEGHESLGAPPRATGDTLRKALRILIETGAAVDPAEQAEEGANDAWRALHE